MNANDQQVGGTHYKGVSISGQEHWDMSWDFQLDGFQHTITKYVMRWRHKGGIEDLEKSLHTLQKYIENVRADEARQRQAKSDTYPTPVGAGTGASQAMAGDQMGITRKR